MQGIEHADQVQSSFESKIKVCPDAQKDFSVAQSTAKYRSIKSNPNSLRIPKINIKALA
jgi:hypothetical protein